MPTKEELLAQGPDAKIHEVLEAFSDGPYHDWASREVPCIKKGLEADDKAFTTMRDMSERTEQEIAGPMHTYCGNSSKTWMSWAMHQFRLKHDLIPY